MNDDLLLALRDIATLASCALDEQAFVSAFVERVQALLGADGVVLRLWDEAAQRLGPGQTSGLAIGADRLLQLGEGLEGEALLGREPLIVADYPASKFADPAVIAGGVRSAAVLPLLAGTRAIGTLLACYNQPRALSAEEIGLLSLLGSQAAHALDAARLRARVEQQEVRRAAVLRLIQRFVGGSDYERLLTDILAEAVALLGGVAGVMNRWDEERQLLRPLRRQMPSDCAPMNLAAGQGVSGRAVRDRAPVIINDYQAVCGQETDTARLHLQAAVAVPLLSGGRVLGSLAVFSAKPGTRYRSEDAALLEILAGITAALLEAIERERLERMVRTSRATHHDALNQLLLAISHAEQMRAAPNLPENVRQIANQMFWDAATAADLLHRLHRIAHLER